MRENDRKSGQFVVPGERLGVIEEFIPGTGTYTKDGVIHSQITGRTLLDMLNKKVSIYPLIHGVSVPKIGSIVAGQVSNVQSKSATLRISQIGNKFLSGNFTGILHISDASLDYVDIMYDVCKPGDIMRAKVISTMNRTHHLSTSERNLGVICSFCSHCGHMLTLQERGLRCPKCGKIEKRKFASDYGKG
ncbi:MAG: exosome complex RNA-binding protein Csl4 [Candidatus Bathyarchaeota archaeon]|nr:exosome complex RNA-binding protein Csl4 [Candidatus Bathyarchaeota archaeon]MDH5732714.1 exosome complex RNA-binding protein Csl4 [Candidatus Bathyarchaeota archaeon]